jgi:hypothetical protein
LSCKSAVNEKIFRAKMRKVISGVILWWYSSWSTYIRRV